MHSSAHGPVRTLSSSRRIRHLWILESGQADNAPMADHLTALQRSLEPHRDALRRLGEAVSIDLFLGWHQMSSQGSFTIEAEFVELLGKIGAEIVLDIHGE
jgi:hypothetical protein